MDDLQVDTHKENLGSRRVPALRMADFPTPMRSCARESTTPTQAGERVDILLVNPPTPDGGLWIRTQHRVGRRTRENMVWPQVSLAQLAALLQPTYT